MYLFLVFATYILYNFSVWVLCFNCYCWLHYVSPVFVFATVICTAQTFLNALEYSLRVLYQEECFSP